MGFVVPINLLICPSVSSGWNLTSQYIDAGLSWRFERGVYLGPRRFSSPIAAGLNFSFRLYRGSCSPFLISSNSSWLFATGSKPLTPNATSPSAIPWISSSCILTNSPICLNDKVVLSTSHTAVARAIRGFAIVSYSFKKPIIELILCRHVGKLRNFYSSRFDILKEIIKSRHRCRTVHSFLMYLKVY